MGRVNLDCHWVGSLDFNFLGNQHPTVKLVAGSTATKTTQIEQRCTPEVSKSRETNLKIWLISIGTPPGTWLVDINPLTDI